MAQYEVKTPDGVLHDIEAVTHVRDSNGLTLLGDEGKTVAMFPSFSWMRLVPAQGQEPVAPVEGATGDAGTSSPVAVGE